MRFVLAAFYTPYSPSRHEVFPVAEIAHSVLHVVGEHGHLECPAFQLVHISSESKDCRESIESLSEVKMVRQNR
jgi:hypothetical protein